MKSKKLLLLLIFNLTLLAILLYIQHLELNKLIAMEFSDKNEVLRTVGFMNINGNYLNLGFISSLILLAINIFLSRNWIELKRWILLPILIFIITTPLVLYLVISLTKLSVV